MEWFSITTVAAIPYFSLPDLAFFIVRPPFFQYPPRRLSHPSHSKPGLRNFSFPFPPGVSWLGFACSPRVGFGFVVIADAHLVFCLGVCWLLFISISISISIFY